MNLVRTMGLIALAGLAGCTTLSASKEDVADEHAAHHPPDASGPAPAEVDQQMRTMQEMHQRMTAAKTPEERQALMAAHMKAMQGGMSMMCGMSGGMSEQGSAQADMMKRCMEMRDMTMQMMMGREAPKAPAK